MATTTPNFGWTVPTSTDLVKDGATAIETLGDGIDASFVDLKGGTTGQVLSKASGTDLDFAWVAQDDSNAIQNAIVDAKGDLIAATAADTPARLAVGTNGQILMADSAEATGLKWATASSALTLIQTNTLAGVTSSTFNDVFTSTYTNYKIMYNLKGTSSSSDFSMRLRASGSDNSSSNYWWSSLYNTSSSGTVFGEISNGTNTAWSIGYGQSSGLAGLNMDIYSPQLTAYTGFTAQNSLVRIPSGSNQLYIHSGGMTVDTSYTGFTILGSSNMTGTISVYGYGK